MNNFSLPSVLFNELLFNLSPRLNSPESFISLLGNIGGGVLRHIGISTVLFLSFLGNIGGGVLRQIGSGVFRNNVKYFEVDVLRFAFCRLTF